MLIGSGGGVGWFLCLWVIIFSVCLWFMLLVGVSNVIIIEVIRFVSIVGIYGLF